jgi:ribosomal protein S24E
MENLKKIKNNLMEREEIEFTIENDLTPSKEEIIKSLSEKLKKPEENIIVESIRGKFGSNTFSVSVLVYDSVESRKKYEVISKKEKKKRAKEEEDRKKKEGEMKKKEEEETKKKEEEKKSSKESQKESEE